MNICYKCHDTYETPLYRYIKPHYGKFCPVCGAFIKWVPKKDIEGGKLKALIQKGLF